LFHFFLFVFFCSSFFLGFSWSSQCLLSFVVLTSIMADVGWWWFSNYFRSCDRNSVCCLMLDIEKLHPLLPLGTDEDGGCPGKWSIPYIKTCCCWRFLEHVSNCIYHIYHVCWSLNVYDHICHPNH
jgi:hypothetical protein